MSAKTTSKYNGVTGYIKTTVDINFPEGYMCCELCPMMHGWERKQCARTGEYLLDGKGIGLYCPLIIKEE